ncbi:metal ABC transporter solute-binding protein, Zn/Mn family [Microbacterium karelineae]|uniref:metal ABC transporter solute-binding protein, Zn/Mn family n=1 Tax=Microbacterium karelineae TaxID=2654283 RepID=UPI0012EA8BE2|nr:zinc ABC transporter substrate-binding protein [Microbacterium karelineae]
MLNRRALIAVPLVAVPALALASCSGSAGGSEAEGDGAGYTIVASTSVYASLAEQVVGDHAEVTAIIDSATQDPHDYEATARDQLAVQGADLVIMNGGGYDSFMDELVEGANNGSGAEAITVVAFNHDYPNDGTDGDEHAEGEHADDEHAEDEHADDEHAEDEHADDEHGEHEHNHIEGFNEHVWYDPHTIEHFVETLAEGLEERIPDAADEIAANAESVIADVAALEDQLAELETAHEGDAVFFTEPIGGYLAAGAGLEDVTTEGFAEAVEEGQDVAPATLLAALEAVEGGDVDVLVVNAQTGGSETDRLIDAANGSGVPIVEFAETLPDSATYSEWMSDNIASLAAALDS